MIAPGASSAPPLGGSPPAVIDRTGLLLVAGLALSAPLGCALGRLPPLRRRSAAPPKPPEPSAGAGGLVGELGGGAPAPWALSLLVASYALLLPGLGSVLFSFDILVDLLGVAKLGVGPHGGLNRSSPTTESMLGLVGLLGNTGSELGAALVVLYAMVVPAAKAALLVLGLWGPRRAAASCIRWVQSISKWASPDVFAYVLLIHLVRGLDYPPLLRAAGRLDLGFSCFSLFCVGSTLATFGLPAPARGAGAKHSSCAATGPTGAPGRDFLWPLVLGLLAAFSGLLAVGLLSPVMALRVRLESLYAPHGPIPERFEAAIKMLKIPEKANVDVSLWRCMGGLLQWARGGEVNSLIAFVLFALFVLFFTVLDMLLLVSMAARLRGGRRCDELERAVRLLGKLSMLDVALMGTVVVTLCMSMYRRLGVVVSLRHCFGELLGAEAVHYATYYVVTSAANSERRRGSWTGLPWRLVDGHGVAVAAEVASQAEDEGVSTSDGRDLSTGVKAATYGNPHAATAAPFAGI